MDNYYWILKYGDYKDLKTVMIPPSAVETVKHRWDNGEPIHTTNGSIPANQIREFERSDRRYTEQPLLESAAQAFHEAIVNPDESVQTKWVKKNVTNNKWDKYYSANPAYRRLGEFNGMVSIAFQVPTHLIDPTAVDYCSDSDITTLTNVK